MKVQRQNRRLSRGDQSRNVANESQNRGSGSAGESWAIKPEIEAIERQRPKVGQGRSKSTVAHEFVEVPNNSVHELDDTRRNVVEIPGNPAWA
jgi:hypothetical protein